MFQIIYLGFVFFKKCVCVCVFVCLLEGVGYANSCLMACI